MSSLRRVFLSILGAVALAYCGGGGGPGPGPTPVITKSGGDNQVAPAGQAIGVLEVTVKDGSGSALSGVTVNWAAATGGGSVTPPSSVTGADGKATATRTLGAGAGTQTTSAGATGATAVTFNHIAQIQGATQIAASGPATKSDTVLSTVAFAALVRDQNNAPVQGVIVTWTLTSGAGALSQATSTTGATGIAIDSLTVTQSAGPRTVQAAVTGLVNSPVTFTHNATAGNATQIALNGGNGQAGPVGDSLPVQHSVILHDAYGNPKANFAVTWTLGLGGGSLSTTAPITSAAGIAGVTRTLGPAAGVSSDTAKVLGLASIPFTDTAAAATNVTVGGAGNVFQPANDTVAAGTFVKFTWGGGVHDVVWDSGPVALTNSPLQTTGTYSVRPTQPGTYNYHCSQHGGVGTGMHAVIVVQ